MTKLIALSQLTFLSCITMYLNLDVRQVRAETAKLPKLPHIHVKMHYNVSDIMQVIVMQVIWCSATSVVGAFPFPFVFFYL